MELWNSGILESCFLKRILFIFSFSSTQILPSTQHRIIPELIIPLFHHSNWGETPNLLFLRSFHIMTGCCPNHIEDLSAFHKAHEGHTRKHS
jgi:hypothetical protein